jgi:uncharacterized protein YjbJ (UPF0337 family)
MNRDTAQGNWQQLKGKIKQKWGKLTDDDLTRAEGDKDYLVGKLHEQYGLAKDRAKDELDNLGYSEKDFEGSAGRAGRMDLSGSDGPESVDENVKADGFSNAQGSPRNKLEAASDEDENVESPGISSKDAPGRL